MMNSLNKSFLTLDSSYFCSGLDKILLVEIGCRFMTRKMISLYIFKQLLDPKFPWAMALFSDNDLKCLDILPETGFFKTFFLLVER